MLNIFGPSGSGKTTLIRNLLEKRQIKFFFESHTKQRQDINLNSRISLSLIPVPIFRGTIKDFFDIFSINLNLLLSLRNEYKLLSNTIFDEINTQEELDKIAIRKVESFSAGEIRRLFLLKSLLVESSIMIIDEPFSNSDEKLWETIYNAIKIKSRAIILSHISLGKLFTLEDENISFHINKIKKELLNLSH
tara:strand:+ start:701 stop:1276 length:576 start_codon:yes stop_codon:yes gene_type:complete